ncbi:MAG: Flp pilus assembly complex ATPase component TadA [Elusimicrobia bacterium]|nr:Flp pilus assembly complex ATPase component TadA [Elusimicrobiota bacterium]
MVMKESTEPFAIARRLGELLVAEGVINYEQLNESLITQKQTGQSLKGILIGKGLVDENKLVEFIAKQCGFKFMRLEAPLKREVLSRVPEKIIRQKKVLPVAFNDDQLTVAISDPLNIVAVDEIKITTGYKVNIVISSDSDIEAAIEKAFAAEESAQKALEELKGKTGERGEVVVEQAKPVGRGDVDEDGVTSISREDEVPVIQIVNLILSRAVKARASDIHIEPYPKLLRVRYRLDGVLHEQPAPPKKFLNAIISRLKIMASLDIAERRRPQDGRIKVRIEDKEIDLRISICPCAPGEKVVMRIMDSSAMMLDLEKLQMDQESFAIYTRHIRDPHGIILVTGPTGSGKSTTLYSTLHALNSPDTNIMTAEDPVEFLLKGVNQVHCNAEIGLNFAAALRTFLRQDPDIIMVGEIRDQETITIAINAALTGHLVFSTLHTNDAPGAITRILMMEVDPILIASALTTVVAQRLVRRICPQCKESYEVDTAWLGSLGVPQKRLPATPKTALYRGKGCENCAGSGYRGRLGIHEVLEVTDEIRELICQRTTALRIREAASKNGMISLQESALRKLMEGHTTAEEVLRVVGGAH